MVIDSWVDSTPAVTVEAEICEMGTLGRCGVGLNNQDTDVEDDLSRSFCDGKDGDLREEFNRGEEGSSSD